MRAALSKLVGRPRDGRGLAREYGHAFHCKGEVVDPDADDEGLVGTSDEAVDPDAGDQDDDELGDPDEGAEGGGHGW